MAQLGQAMRSADASRAPAIALKSVHKRFGAHVAVRDVSFAVGAGEIVGFVGPNGAGKTTTLRIISGFLDPDKGSVQVAGYDVTRQRMQARAHLGYMPEGVPAYRDMRVAEYLRMRGRLRGIARKRLPEQLERACQRSGLLNVQRRIIGHLSQGYRQRVGLADALLAEPPILLLDEPTAGLDPLQVREFRSLLYELAEHCTVLVSSHILPELQAVASRLLVISSGSLVGAGTMGELRARCELAQDATLEAVFVALHERHQQRDDQQPTTSSAEAT